MAEVIDNDTMVFRLASSKCAYAPNRLIFSFNILEHWTQVITVDVFAH